MIGVLLTGALVAAGCGGGDDGPAVRTGHCWWTAENICTQVSGPFTDAQVAEGRAGCVNFGGTFAMSPCPTEYRIAGYCTFDPAAEGLPAGSSMKDYYYTGWDAGTAQAFCESPAEGGTWHP
jgi:hypothetical protein